MIFPHFAHIAPSSMEKCEERKSLATVSIVSPQKCVFYRTKIHRTVSKQPIRVENLIKQKPRDAFAFQVS